MARGECAFSTRMGAWCTSCRGRTGGRGERRGFPEWSADIPREARSTEGPAWPARAVRLFTAPFATGRPRRFAQERPTRNHAASKRRTRYCIGHTKNTKRVFQITCRPPKIFPSVHDKTRLQRFNENYTYCPSILTFLQKKVLPLRSPSYTKLAVRLPATQQRQKAMFIARARLEITFYYRHSLCSSRVKLFPANWS